MSFALACPDMVTCRTPLETCRFAPPNIFCPLTFQAKYEQARAKAEQQQTVTDAGPDGLRAPLNDSTIVDLAPLLPPATPGDVRAQHAHHRNPHATNSHPREFPRIATVPPLRTLNSAKYHDVWLLVALVLPPKQLNAGRRRVCTCQTHQSRYRMRRFAPKLRCRHLEVPVSSVNQNQLDVIDDDERRARWS